VGEESGNMEEILLFLADFHEKEIDYLSKNLTSIMEPVLLITIGLAVAVVALGIITPIYQITGSFQFQ
jgi:MSHA biogenesis protein MshG